MPHRPRHERPENSHDYRDGSDYIPFDTISVIEKERTEKPLLYDHRGTPLTSQKPKIGFK